MEFSDTNIPDTLLREVSLSLFRVIQEALRNAVKYSGEKRFEVYLHGKAGEIDLEISNRGVGFDVSRAKGNRGWGLVNMAERVHLVNGTFNVDSQLNGGTRICVRVPVGTKPKAPTSDAN